MVVMKNKLFKLIISLIFISCCKQGYAQLTTDTIGCLPLVVRFKSPDQSIDKIYWNFGDGASSEKLNPTHVFVDTGTFKIELFSNSIKLYEQTIKILPEINIAFTSDINKGCAPTAVLFKNNSVKPKEITTVNYFWDFGDGTSSSSANPSHTYIDEGNFSVTLNVTTNIELCNNSKTIDNMIDISGKLDVRFRIDSIVPECDNPSTVFFTYQGTVNNNYNYRWDFGDGDASTFYGIKSHTYQSAGTKVIKLTVDNNNGCIASFSRTIALVAKENIFDISYPDTICEGMFIPFENNSVQGKYLWNFGKDASQETSVEKTPKNIHYNSEGWHSFNLTIEAGNCTIDSTSKIFLSIPNAEFDIIPDPICNDPYMATCIAQDTSHQLYIWNDTPDKWFHIISDTIPQRDSFYFNNIDLIGITLTIVSKHGCVSTKNNILRVNKIDAHFFVSEHYGLVPLKVMVKDTSLSLDTIVQWIYTWGDGTQNIYDKNNLHLASHTYTEAGQYYINLKIITKNGCIDEYYGAIIDVGEAIEENNIMCSSSSGQLEFCVGDTIQLQVNNYPDDIDAFHFHLENTVSHCEKDDNVSFIADGPGTFQAAVELERDGVFKTINGPLISIKGAKAKITYETRCGADKYKVEFKDSSINASKIYWQVEGKIITEKSFNYDFKKPGDYQVILTAENELDGCLPHSDTVIIYLRDVKANINMKDTWCSNQFVVFDASGSEDVYASCSKGYVWFFPENKDQRPLKTEKEKIAELLKGGEYLVGLSVDDVNGCKDTAYHRISNINIEAKFDMDYNEICIPLKVNFTDQSTHDAQIEKWEWSFDDNQNTPNPAFTFTTLQKDTIFIILKVTDIYGCNDIDSLLVTSYQPTIEIISDSIICEVNDVKLSASDFTEKGSMFDYYWDVEGVGIFKSKNVTLADLNPGKYKVKVRGTEKSTGCYADESKEIFVINKPNAVIEALTDSVFCFPQTLTVKSISQIDSMDTPIYSWNFGNGRASSRAEPVITYGKGEYRMRLIVRSKFNCNDTAYQNIKLVGPEGKIAADKNVVCKNEEIKFTLSGAKDVSSFFWDFGQGETGSNVNPVSYRYNFLPPSGKTFASIVLESEETGCETILTLPIEIKKVSANFEDASSCDPVIVFENKSVGADIFQWKFANLATSGETNPQFTFPNAGTYNVTLKIENNELKCKDSIEKIVTIFLKPTINVPSTINYCSGDNYELKFDAPYEVSFSPSDIISQENDSTYLITANGDVTLSILAINEFGCEASKMVIINYNENVNQDTTVDLYSCSNGKLTIPLNIKQGDDIIWTSIENIDLDSLSCINCENPILSYTENGVLTATISNGDNCEVRKITFNIAEVKAEVPNVFSPNNDENNDVFRPVVIPESQQENLIINSMKVFSRWGNEIYSVSNTNKGWDGNHGSNAATEEVYYFNVTYTLSGGCVFNKKGNVTLVR